MVQALLNNMNIQMQTPLSNTVQKAGAVDSSISKTDFQALFDKQAQTENLQKKEDLQTENPTIAGTLGAFKEKTENTVDTVKEGLEKLAGILKDTEKDVSEELSLDLTLAKDVQTEENTEIIPAEPTDEQTTNNDNITNETEDTMENPKITDENQLIMSGIIQNFAVNNQQKQENITQNTGEETGLKVETAVITADEELNVTINGKDLNSYLNDFNLTNSAEETIVSKAVIQENGESEGASLEDIVDEEILKELNIESVETETGDTASDGGGDLMQHQSAEEHGLKAMLQTNTDYAEVQAAKSVQAQPAAKTSAAELGSDKIIEQITKQMEGLYNGSKVNMVLNPESLGKVSIQLVNTKEGLSAQFTCATQEARDLIMKGLDGLKDTLLSHGVNVDNVSVKLNDTQKSEYNADWTEQEGSRGGNKEQGARQDKEKDGERFENLMSFAQDEEN